MQEFLLTTDPNAFALEGDAFHCFWRIWVEFRASALNPKRGKVGWLPAAQQGVGYMLSHPLREDVFAILCKTTQ